MASARSWITLILVSLSLGSSACVTQNTSSWVDNAPVEIAARALPRDGVEQRLLDRAAALGYDAEAVKTQGRGHLYRFKAHLRDAQGSSGKSSVDTDSYFTLELLESGGVTLRAFGYYVRGDKIRPLLRAEFDVLARELQGAVAS